jgi:uncharacterized surface protein with fasciclin (FAS1) repeats
MRGQVALGSVILPSDSYPKDNSGNFLGINGVSNKDVITGLVAGSLGYVAYSTISDTRAGVSGKSSSPPATAEKSNKSIYSVLKSMPDDFSEITKLIEKSQLESTLRENGPYTFLAPTNAALLSLSTIERAELENPSNKDALILWIKRHIVKGRYSISEISALKDGSSLPTLSGEKIEVRNLNDALSLDGAEVIQNDIRASNGWIHPINRAMDNPIHSDK